MTKKDKRAVSGSIAGFMLLFSLFLYWVVFKSTNVYVLFGLIIGTPIIERMIYSILPEKKSKKRSNGEKPEKNKEIVNTPSNRLRADKEIIGSRLEDLSWREFERLCFLYFKAKGYKVRETGEGADGGVDLIIYNRHYKAKEAIQIKHYLHSGNQINVTKIRELHAAKRNHKCILSRFITTSTYTNTALREADSYKMICHDLNWVENKIVKWQEEEMSKVV